jgi:Insulin-induced protein (INSIG)
LRLATHVKISQPHGSPATVRPNPDVQSSSYPNLLCAPPRFKHSPLDHVIRVLPPLPLSPSSPPEGAPPSFLHSQSFTSFSFLFSIPSVLIPIPCFPPPAWPRRQVPTSYTSVTRYFPALIATAPPTQSRRNLLPAYIQLDTDPSDFPPTCSYLLVRDTRLVKRRKSFGEHGKEESQVPYNIIMPSDGPPILRPTPRRPFDLNVTSATPPEPSTPAEPGDPHHLDTRVNGNGGSETFRRTRSILNLTSSTLFGIYSPAGYSEREEPSTPWGTGAETPHNRRSFDGELPALASRTERPSIQRRSSQYGPSASLPSQIFNFALRTILLFSFGMGYGILVTHLHNDQRLAPFQVEGIIKPSYNWSYLIFWGVAGVGLGSLLPWVDTVWEDTTSIPEHHSTKERIGTPEIEEDDSIDSGFAAEWNPVVRSIGAFVGIAFAIVSLALDLEDFYSKGQKC